MDRGSAGVDSGKRGQLRRIGFIQSDRWCSTLGLIKDRDRNILTDVRSLITGG